VNGFQGHLDLQLGSVDPQTGIARVSVVGASPFLSLDLGGMTLCVRPLVPALDAGVIDCDGGSSFDVRTLQDHNVGQVGVGGFTAQDCELAGGAVEDPAQPHPNVCNGPIATMLGEAPDSGSGALLIAPLAQFGTSGLPVEFDVQTGPCKTGGPQEVFAFSSEAYRAEITDAGNVGGAVLVHEEVGENFSCAGFTQENGPGRLVFSLGTLHGLDTADAILVFVLDD
jgi:hypothetical protein